MAERVYNWEDLHLLPLPETFTSNPITEAQDEWRQSTQEHLRGNHNPGAWVMTITRLAPFEQEVSVLVTRETDVNDPQLAGLFPDTLDGEPVVYVKMDVPQQ